LAAVERGLVAFAAVLAATGFAGAAVAVVSTLAAGSAAGASGSATAAVGSGVGDTVCTALSVLTASCAMSGVEERARTAAIADPPRLSFAFLYDIMLEQPRAAGKGCRISDKTSSNGDESKKPSEMNVLA
jgi:hypothetical protein